jgi:hypothetical protein
MPYDFHWNDDTHTLIRYEVHGKVTWHEWCEAMDKIAAELAPLSHRVDVIFNNTAGLPSGNPIPPIKWAKAKLATCSNLGRVVTVSEWSQWVLIYAFIRIVDRAHGEIPIVATLNEALQVIAVAREKGHTRLSHVMADHEDS